jgi:choline dehydrogenase-like flavoprotein
MLGATKAEGGGGNNKYLGNSNGDSDSGSGELYSNSTETDGGTTPDTGVEDSNTQSGRKTSEFQGKKHQAKRKQGPLSNKAAGVEYISGGVVRRVFLRTASSDVSNRKSSNRDSKPQPKTSSTQTSDQLSKGGVILTAGALMTPKVLMNSGIGRPEILQASGVNVRVNSTQVGRNLRDHPAVAVVSYADPTIFAGTEKLVYFVLFACLTLI